MTRSRPVRASLVVVPPDGLVGLRRQLAALAAAVAALEALRDTGYDPRAVEAALAQLPARPRAA